MLRNVKLICLSWKMILTVRIMSEYQTGNKKIITTTTRGEGWLSAGRFPHHFNIVCLLSLVLTSSRFGKVWEFPSVARRFY